LQISCGSGGDYKLRLLSGLVRLLVECHLSFVGVYRRGLVSRTNYQEWRIHCPESGRVLTGERGGTGDGTEKEEEEEEKEEEKEEKKEEADDPLHMPNLL